MQLLKKILSPFARPNKSFTCGGEGLITVTDIYGRISAKIWYDRPTSEMIMTYAWELSQITNDESNLKQIKDSENKMSEMHKVLWDKVMLPYAEKVFLRSVGYVDKNGEPIDRLTSQEQFEIIKKFNAHHLAQMAEKVFSSGVIVKKKN